MALPAKERFDKTGVNIQLRGRDVFEFSYKYDDKGTSYDKKINLHLLGKSNQSDLIGEVGGEQFCYCDDKGEIYEACIYEDGVKIMLYSLRSNRVK